MFTVPLLADSRTEAALRQQIEIERAARVSAERERAAMAATLRQLGMQGMKRDTALAGLAGEQRTAHEQAVADAAEAARTAALEAQKSTASAWRVERRTAILQSINWSTLAAAIMGVIGSILTWKNQKKTDAKVTQIQVNVDGRVTQLLEKQDELLTATKKGQVEREEAAHARGKLEGGQGVAREVV